MNFRKIFQYGLMVTCLSSNVMAMNTPIDLPENAILRHESLRDIKAASELALAESRELHMFLGANPSEHHVAQLRAEEEKREIEEGIKAPIRLYFVNACGLYGIQTSSAKTPILHADFNKEESWNTILEALMLMGGSFNGVFDKIYFDVSTAKGARWYEGVLAKITALLKKSGELYIPDAKLASQSLFCDSYVDQQSYHKLTKAEKKDLPYPVNYQTVDKCFLSSGGITTVEERGGAYYAYNSLNLVYDTTFQFSKIIGYPLKFEVFESDKMYPDIGMKYRQEPEQIIQQYLRINSFIKMTLVGTEKREAEEIILDTAIISERKEKVINEELPILNLVKETHKEPIVPNKTETHVILEEDIEKREIEETSLKVPTVDKTANEMKENVVNKAAQELSVNVEATKIFIPEGYKEAKFPSLNVIKDALLLGRSTVSSDTDFFCIQSIMGTFFGFKSDVKDFGLEMLSATLSKKDNGSYRLFGLFRVMFEDSKVGIPISLNSNIYDNFMDGTPVEKSFYKVSNPEELKIIVPVKKREPFLFPTPTTIAQPTTPTIVPNTQKIIYSARYCPDLYRKVKKNSEAIQKIYYDDSHGLQGDNRTLLLRIREELREAEDIIDTIENPNTTVQDRALVAVFSPDRKEEMSRLMRAAQKKLELSDWLQKIGFRWS